MCLEPERVAAMVITWITETRGTAVASWRGARSGVGGDVGDDGGRVGGFGVQGGAGVVFGGAGGVSGSRAGAASLISMIESGHWSPSRDFAARCDEVFRTPGTFARLEKRL